MKRRVCVCFIMALLLFQIGCVHKESAVKEDVRNEDIKNEDIGKEDVRNEDIKNEDVKTEDMKEIEDIVREKGNKFSCTYDSTKHDFVVDLPNKVEGAPLVVMLHGYGESAEGFRSTTHFEEKANALGYAVVYVTGASNPKDATSASGWNSGIGMEGNKDVEFLVALAKYLQKEYSLDKKRTFAVGFSNGAFMTHRLAMEAGDTYAAVVSVAGMMPESIWNERSETNEVGFFQITGEKDDVVPKNSDGSAKYSQAPAIEEVMDYMVKSNGLELLETCEIGTESILSKYGSETKQTQVWDLFIKDGRHSWPSESINGMDINALILEFLETQ